MFPESSGKGWWNHLLPPLGGCYFRLGSAEGSDWTMSMSS